MYLPAGYKEFELHDEVESRVPDRERAAGTGGSGWPAGPGTGGTLTADVGSPPGLTSRWTSWSAETLDDDSVADSSSDTDAGPKPPLVKTAGAPGINAGEKAVSRIIKPCDRRRLRASR